MENDSKQMTISTRLASLHVSAAVYRKNCSIYLWFRIFLFLILWSCQIKSIETGLYSLKLLIMQRLCQRI